MDDEDTVEDKRVYFIPWYVQVLRVVAGLGLIAAFLAALAEVRTYGGRWGGLGVAALTVGIGVVGAAVSLMFAETAGHVAVMRQQLEYMLDMMDYEQDLRENEESR